MSIIQFNTLRSMDKEKKEMLVKGNALESAGLFVKEKFPDRYQEWLNKLPTDIAEFYKNTILQGDWYSNKFVAPPVEAIAEMFFNGNKQKAYYEIGKYSFNRSYNTIYKPMYEGIEREVLANMLRDIIPLYALNGVCEVIDEKFKVEYIFKNFPKLFGDNFARFAGFIGEMFNHFYKPPIDIKYYFEVIGDDEVIGYNIFYFD